MTTTYEVSEVERDLAAAISGWLRRHWPAGAAVGALDAAADAPTGPTASLWARADTDFGLAAFLLDEAAGGQGASLREAAVVAREVGRAAAPLPVVSRFLAQLVLNATLEAAPLRDLVNVGLDAAPLLPAGTVAAGAAFEAIRLDGAVVSGGARPVPGLTGATHLLVPGLDQDEPVLVLVPVDVTGVSLRPLTGLDATVPVHRVELTGAPVQAVLARGDQAGQALVQGLNGARALLCAEQSALARACLDATVEYALVRSQFGRLIGSFQALKHRMADLWLVATSADSAARAALTAAAGTSPQAAQELAMAAVFCGEAAVRTAEERLQLRGGIGMTWEDATHLYLKRAKTDQVLLGGTGRLLDGLADALLT